MKAHNKIMVLGGYGTFGKRIVQQLCQQNTTLIIAGRNRAKAQKLADKLSQNISAQASNCVIKIAIFDVHTELANALNKHQPKLIIHTCGPFQGQTTAVAQTCIKFGIHCIDLSDARDFVAQMLKLDQQAKAKKVMLITAASTVPTLSSAVIEHFMQTAHFAQFQNVKYGITPGQKTERGLATTKAVLSYIGKVIKPGTNDDEIRYGWQNTYLQKYPEIGNRLMGNCEIPDRDLLQKYYPIDTLQFSAGMESKLFHLIIWLISWLVRLKIPLNLVKHARLLVKLGRKFDCLGSHDGGMHVAMQGTDKTGKQLTKTWFIIAKNADGPMIPTIPAVLMANKIVQKEYQQYGSKPCIGILTLEEYLNALKDYDVKTYVL